MARHWRDVPFDALQEGIARLRELSLQIEHAHELVTANRLILERDREHVRFGAAPAPDDVGVEPQLERAGSTSAPRLRHGRRARRRD